MGFLLGTRLVFLRSLRPPLRNPVSVLVGIALPLIYLVLFGPLLRGIAGSSGTSSWQWFVPGMMIQLTLFGTAYAGFSLLPELRSGVMARLRVSPISRPSLLIGRVLKDVAILLVQAALFLGASTAFGFRASIPGVLIALVLVALTGVAIGVASYTLALKVRHEYVFAPILSAVLVPLMLLSGVLLPMQLGPRWLYDVSRANPLSHVVDAARAAAAGDYASQTVLLGTAIAAGLILVCTAWGIWSFAHEQS
jgi:ABC-2 type transport system permease protein